MSQVSQNMFTGFPQPPRLGATERWQIWGEQLDQGKTPCFRTTARFFCRDTDCPLREQCLSLRAAWRR